ncbi:MAG: PfkB family kinase [Parcubacteria group bacterium Athens0714_25]|nr:MAG: PfkB family kinase [Parcubacteria group bacterium Athens0714_25]
MKQIICIGSSCKDMFFPTAEGVVIETPDDLLAQRKIYFELGAKYKIDRVFEAPGGCAANVAQGLSRLGIKTGIFTKIGADAEGKWIVDELEKEGIETDLVQVDDNCRTDFSSIIVDIATKDHVVFWNRDSNEKLEVLPKKILGAEWIFVSALNGDWHNHLDVIMETSQEKGIKIAFNPGQKNIHDDPEKIFQAIKKSRVLILNKDEAVEIISQIEHSGSVNLNDEKFLLKEFSKTGCKAIVITDGSRGAWACAGESFYFCPGIKIDTVDTLGAGDAFTGAFLAAYLQEKDIKECLQWGAANGSNVAKFYGAKEGLLKTKEMEIKIKNIKVDII